MGQRSRRDIVLQILTNFFPTLPPQDPLCIEMLAFALSVKSDPDVLHWIIQCIPGHLQFFEALRLEPSPIHAAMMTRLSERDMACMRIIVSRTPNLHEDFAGLDSNLWKRHTPTMLAMYDMNLFRLWRDLLIDLDLNIQEFVKRELETLGGLRAEGWNNKTLMQVFELDFHTLEMHSPERVASRGGIPQCERCGKNTNRDGEVLGDIMVDVAWRRFLKCVRYGIDYEKAEESEYRSICPEVCRDGVCVAWIHDEVIGEDDDFNSQVSNDDTGSPDEADIGECLTQRMPGAFPLD